MTKDLIPLDGYGEYADQGSGSYEKMKEIRMCVDLMKEARAEGITIGNFFTFDANVAQGEKPVMKDIGNEFLAIVIRDAQWLAAYDNDTKQYLLSSSEFRSNTDPIILYDRTVTGDNVEEITACLPYTNKADTTMSIKYLKETKHTKIRTKYVTYLLFEGELYKFGFAATDNTGCEADAFKPLGFADAADDSFMHVKARCHSEAGANLMFSHVLRIFSKPAFKKSVDFIKGFEISGRVLADRKEEIDGAIDKLYESLRIRFQKKTIKAWDATINKDAIVCFDKRHIPYLVANPRIFTQQEKLPRLDAGTEVPEIQAPIAHVAQKSSEENVIDVAEELFGKSEELTIPDMSKKPRNKAEAIAQKKEEREYIAESGVGEKAVEAVHLAKDTAEEKRKNDPELAEFLKDTEVAPAKEEGKITEEEKF